jgi:hypothetical protein
VAVAFQRSNSSVNSAFRRELIGWENDLTER